MFTPLMSGDRLEFIANGLTTSEAVNQVPNRSQSPQPTRFSPGAVDHRFRPIQSIPNRRRSRLIVVTLGDLVVPIVLALSASPTRPCSMNRSATRYT